MRDTSIMDLLDYGGIEKKVQQLFGRVQKYEQMVGFDEIDPTEFRPSGLSA